MPLFCLGSKIHRDVISNCVHLVSVGAASCIRVNAAYSYVYLDPRKGSDLIPFVVDLSKALRVPELQSCKHAVRIIPLNWFGCR